MSLEPCECPAAGFCHRHQMKMSAKRHSICNGTSGWCEDKAAAYLAKLSERRTNSPEPTVCTPRRKGPGTYLKESLEWFHLRGDGACNCEDRVRQMNQWGPQGCREHLDEICAWLRESAWRLGIPMTDLILRPLVLLAISKSEQG